MNFRFFLVLFLISAVLGCKKKQKQYVLVDAKISQKKIALLDTTQYVKIPIDTNGFFFYKTYAVKSDKFVGYNEKKRTLDLFSLTNEQQLKSIVLDPLILDLKNGVRDVFYQNTDSIFIFNNQDHIYLIDSGGKLKSKIPLNSASPNLIFKRVFAHEWDLANNMFYDDKSKILYMPTMSVSERRDSPDFYKSEILMTIDLGANNLMKTVPIFYSPLYKSHYFGFANAPKFSFSTPGMIIYSFGIEPNIYAYDLKRDSNIVIGGALKQYPFVSKQLEFKSAFDDDLKMDNLLHNVDYCKVLRDPFRNLYYRFQYNPVSDKPGKAATENDRTQFLTIFDEHMHIINTIELNDRRYIVENSFVTADGLYVPAPTGTTSLSFKLFKIAVK